MALIKISSIFVLVIFVVIQSQFSKAEHGVGWEALFENSTSVYMGDSRQFNLTIENLTQPYTKIRVVSDSGILKVSEIVLTGQIEQNEWVGSFAVDARFIGSANVFVEIDRHNASSERSVEHMHIWVMRIPIINEVFMFYFGKCVLLYYFIMYVNFGIVLDLQRVKAILKKPLIPSIAFICNFVFTPLV